MNCPAFHSISRRTGRILENQQDPILFQNLLKSPGAAGRGKTVSYVRKEFRATAEARKRPPLIVEAMVDSDVEIPGVVEKGKLLTLTTEEALKHKIASFAPTRSKRS